MSLSYSSVQDIVVPKAKDSRSRCFRPDIEGLRGIAILIVVAFHCGIRPFYGGFIGVDVFFVLSGYLITGLLVAEIEKTKRLNLVQFYARRVRRLLPASTLTLVATLVAGMIIFAPEELTFAGRAARATAVYMSNVFFALNASDYFAPAVETNPMLHTWSLAVEEQFYVFWPLLIILGMQVGRSRKALAALMSFLTVISLVACVWLTMHGGTFAFYGLPTRAWEFGIGGLAALVPCGSFRLPVEAWLAFGWLGLLSILASGILISGNTGFPGWIAIAPVLGTVLALVAGAKHPHAGAGVLLDSAPLQLLGTLSYSWYLWHWPFLVLSKALFPGISTAGKIGVALASLSVAAITHYLFENPIRFHPQLVKRPALSLGLGAVMTVCSLTAAFLSIRFAVQLENAPAMKAIAAAADDIADMPRQQCVSLGQSPDVKSCTFGDESSAVNVVLFGDSHAIQWFNPLQKIVRFHNWKLTTMVKSGCPATDINPPGTAAFEAGCAAWRAQAIHEIIAQHPSIVFLGNATTYLGRKDTPSDQVDVSLDAWREGTKRTLQYLTSAGIHVVSMRDTPLPSFDIPTCLARSYRHSWYPGGSCQIDKTTSLTPAVFEAEKVAAQGLANVYFLDVTDQLCQGNTCWAVKNGRIAYRDDNHLTGSFAESLMPAIDTGLTQILNLTAQNPGR